VETMKCAGVREKQGGGRRGERSNTNVARKLEIKGKRVRNRGDDRSSATKMSPKMTLKEGTQKFVIKLHWFIEGRVVEKTAKTGFKRLRRTQR